ncbi:hypothetical protein GWI33_004098 [Rhynchophorus ferrugineus]|uniref:Protein transport protein Sec31A n=1 Tax=Rhynchophorus ferrugineus TaxID=354439 RepID=A0A834INH6_RHYFE|nr:hypothetical protein GWI33_004098 [Rhynchophorus ferrugineus]
MKVKDIERTANVAWSPKNYHPIYLAAGTAAQQLDASFSTNATLEIYALNVAEPGPDTQLVSSLSTESRFHKIIWGSAGNDNAGTIIGGCDDGVIQIYSASKLLKSGDALIGKQQKHTGPVHALDFNRFQQNLFATGAGESEIFIWDLNNTTTPMSPGAKTQPSEDVLSVAWNKQVQHILASSFSSKCVIWDLRKNEPIIKLTDTVSRIRWKMVAWHPEVATQLCLASEEDHSPVVQMWDLRFATSPLKVLENHQRGVLAVSWCDDDSDLLISCGKDDRILCWNPNSFHTNGEVLSEIAKTNQWSFDVAWCPRNPALIACPNYDGHVSVYSLMGGKTQQIQTTNKIADSFPGMDGFVQAPAPQQTNIVVCNDPTKPPKWLRKPVGAKFGFGGKLVAFEHNKEVLVQAQQLAQSGQVPSRISRTVEISQVITEPEFVQKASQLEQALESCNFVEYCLNKANETNDQHKKYIWHYLKANFEQNPRGEILNLLGYKIEDINIKLAQHIGKPLLQNNVDDLTDQLNSNRIEDYGNQDPFSAITEQNSISKKPEPFKINTNDDTEGLITQALLLNNVESAVELCLKSGRYADALVIATTGGPDLLAKTQHQYLEHSEGYISNLISALISEDWGSIINNCEISSWKEALAAALTHASEEDLPILCEQLGSRLEQESSENPKYMQDAQLCYICSGNFDRLVNSWSGNALNSTKDLQELVELVSFLQKSIERQGKRVQISGALADLLSQYASILAGQGHLQTALSYLGSSQNGKVASLRDRLMTSLGQKPSNVQELRHQQGSRRGSTRTSFNATNPFHPQNQFNPPPPQFTPPVPQFGQNFNTGLPNPTLNAQPWQTQSLPATAPVATQPPKVFSPPPRPDSVGSSRGGTAGALSRKYILDPSVGSNQYPTRNQYGQPIPQQPVAMFNSNTPYNTPSVGQQPPAQMFQPPPIGTTSPAVPNPPLNPTPFVPNQPFQPSQPVVPAEQAIDYQSQAAPGWNDPPPLNRPLKTQYSSNNQTMSPLHSGIKLWRKPKTEQVSSAPITHPLYGMAPGQPQPASNGFGSGFPPTAQGFQQQTGYNTPYAPPTSTFAPPSSTFAPPQPTFAPPPTGGFNPSNFNQNAVLGAAPQTQTPPAPQVVKPEPVQKLPLPAEHEVIQNIFEELKDRCSCAANNAQTKRKLEDVGRRLETLYDSLRYNKLSPNALNSLHQIIQFIQNGDYTNGLHLHTQLVQGPDFALIASFMPGVKVLLQVALQLHVYLN